MKRTFTPLEVFHICRAFGLSIDGWLFVACDLEKRGFKA